MPQSRFTALLGLNGAGKTTLFSLITRLYDTRHGSIDVLGHRVSREPGRALRLLGVVFQARTLDLDISVMDNLLYHAALHGIGGREARRTRTCRAARRSNWPTARATRCADCRADRCGGSRSRARCCIGRACWCWTNRRSAWTSRPAPRSCAMCARSSASAALPCLWATHLLDEVATDDAVVVLHRGRVLAAGDVPDVVASAGAADMRSAFIALTGGAPEAPE